MMNGSFFMLWQTKNEYYPLTHLPKLVYNTARTILKAQNDDISGAFDYCLNHFGTISTLKDNIRSIYCCSRV